jgi:hypothetical protein
LTFAAREYTFGMPVVSRFLGIVIAMYWNDHPPPHFHAKYGGTEAVIEIESGKSFGHLPPRVMSLVQEWRVLHENELMENWRAAMNRVAMKNIEPLE